MKNRVYYLKSLRDRGPFKKGEVYKLHWGYHARDMRMCWGILDPTHGDMWSLGYAEDPSSLLKKIQNENRWELLPQKGIPLMTKEEIWG